MTLDDIKWAVAGAATGTVVLGLIVALVALAAVSHWVVGLTMGAFTAASAVFGVLVGRGR